jgi:hypothetical protein
LERLEVKAERTKKNHAKHNNGGAKRLVVTTSLDDESKQICNSNSKEFR